MPFFYCGRRETEMLARFNQFIERWIFLVTPVCVILGVVFSDITIHGNVLVPYVFAVMTFIGALKSSFQDIVHVFRHPLPLLLSFLLSFLPSVSTRPAAAS